jgi:hypothetical protein
MHGVSQLISRSFSVGKIDVDFVKNNMETILLVKLLHATRQERTRILEFTLTTERQ